VKHCGSCGARLIRQQVAAGERERLVCAACNAVHYQNPRIIVGCVVCWQDSILLCRRAQEPALGQWIIPSGFLECGETLEEGAARETLEETGVSIDPASLDLYTVANMTTIEQVAISFRVVLTNKPEIRPGPECLEAAFITETDIPSTSIAWRCAMQDRPQRLFHELRSGTFTIQLVAVGSGQGVGFRSREYIIQSVVNTNT
jgi:ADP-ribose pyrophosphatase YjhB (NUDIX family)